MSFGEAPGSSKSGSSELEEEAKNIALKHVSTLFQRPDHLLRVEQFKVKTARKQASVDAMLKTGVSSQLEGVRTGLTQLEDAMQDLNSIHERLTNIEHCLAEISPLKDKLRKLKEESRKRSQYFAAIENLQHIFQVPETIEKTKELISDGKLLHAHKNIMELEGARDDLLLEMHRQKVTDKHEIRLLQAYFSDVNAVSDELAKQMWYILRRTLDTVRGQPAKIVTPLRIIEREERIDEMCQDRNRATGFLPPGRPRHWKKKCFEILEEVVVNRIEGTQLEDKTVNKQWLVRYLELCRQRVREDLNIVISLCDPIFPPRYAIRQAYVEMYHRAVADRLREIATESLDKNELIHLLSWIKAYNDSEMLSEGQAFMDIADLVARQPLLPRTVLDALIGRFVEFVRTDMEGWLQKALSQEKDEWYRGEEPEKDGLGIYISTLPSTLFQMIDGQTALAKQIGDEATLRVMDLCVDSLIAFTNNYRAAAEAYNAKHFENRDRFAQIFTTIMVFVANTCQICEESCDSLRSQAKSAGADHQTTQRHALLRKIDTMKEGWERNLSFGLDCIVEEICSDLRPHLNVILTKQWCGSEHALGSILLTLSDYFKDYEHGKPVLQVRLLERIQLKLLAEYLKGVTARRIVFANKDERRRAADQLEREGKEIRDALEKHVPRGHDLDILVDILPAMAGVLSLSDHSILPLEVSSFVQKFPDVSQDQLAGLISLREDTSKSDAATLATDLLHQNRFKAKQHSPYEPLFQLATAEMPKTMLGNLLKKEERNNPFTTE